MSREEFDRLMGENMVNFTTPNRNLAFTPVELEMVIGTFNYERFIENYLIGR